MGRGVRHYEQPIADLYTLHTPLRCVVNDRPYSRLYDYGKRRGRMVLLWPRE